MNLRKCRFRAPLVALALIAAGCAPERTPPGAEAIAPLPVAVSNNAVAALDAGDHFRLYSFLGLLAGKTWRDVTDRAFEYDSRTGRWSELPPVPGGAGRLAATAETVAGRIYLFGGYTVAEDGVEVSTPEVYRFDPQTRRYEELPPMPVPVDDAVSGVYRDRYVYLVSGWHHTDNVTNVQVLDTQTRSWLQATPYPGPPLFGHAGGLAGGALVICDGVKVVPPASEGERRRFVISDACYRGEIDPVDPTRISWRPLPPHPGAPTYRAGAAGIELPSGARIVFAGGTDNPYNYDGIGYDGVPAQPLEAVFSYSPADGRWHVQASLSRPSMDHRGLLLVAGNQAGLLIGGLGPGQLTSSAVIGVAVDPG